MREEELVARVPRLWHMATDGSWPAIRAQGLLSTSALLDLYGLEGEAREALEARRRPRSVALARAGLPGAVVRDQTPLAEAALARCLADGLTPADWYRLLNGLVFFWPSRARLRRLLAARLYRAAPQTVLTVDTASLLAAHRDRVRLSPINSGSAIRAAPARGRDTFRTVADVPFEDWRRRRGPGEAIAEFVVAGGVPDIAAHLRAVHRVAEGVASVLWRREDAGGEDGP